VVDVNVAVVANRKSPQAGKNCIEACLSALEEIKRNRCLLVIDDRWRILPEYSRNMSKSGQPEPGDAFLKWALANQSNPRCCERVSITPTEPPEDYAEFPRDPDLDGFDRNDRKYVAAALASRNSPEVLNAVDSDWWDFRIPLERNGVRIRFLCPDCVQRARPPSTGTGR